MPAHIFSPNAPHLLVVGCADEAQEGVACPPQDASVHRLGVHRVGGVVKGVVVGGKGRY